MYFSATSNSKLPIANSTLFCPKSCPSNRDSGGPAGVVLAGFLGFESIEILRKMVMFKDFLNTSYSVNPFVIMPKSCTQTNLCIGAVFVLASIRSEEHTSELQSPDH